MIVQASEFWVADIPFTSGASSIGRVSDADAERLKTVWHQHVKPQF
jgi:hypothetical protein